MPYTGRRMPMQEMEVEGPTGEYAAANSDEAGV